MSHRTDERRAPLHSKLKLFPIDEGGEEGNSEPDSQPDSQPVILTQPDDYDISDSLPSPRKRKKSNDSSIVPPGAAKKRLF